MEIVSITAVVIAALVATGWIGLLFRPAAFEPVAGGSTVSEYVNLPGGLPVPVERFYRKLYGDQVPVVESAVISGRGTMRIGGIRFPARYRFIHDAGTGYRHYIETTFFRRPIMKVNEYYLDGQSRMELPFGVTENEPKVNQGANLALWAESLAWLPGLMITSDRIAWESVDRHEADLIVPFDDAWERISVHFNSDTGLFERAESMRYRAADSEEKTLWINEVENWARVNGHPVSRIVKLTWGDEGSPWARFTVDEVVYNADVAEIIREKGIQR